MSDPRSRRSHPFLRDCWPRILVVLAVFVAAGAGCGEGRGPTQQVEYAAGSLRLAISQDWVAAAGSPGEMVFKHVSDQNVSLTLREKTHSWEGPPIPVTAIRGLVGKELNLKFGNVLSRITLKGNALNTYPWQDEDADGDVFYTQNWVLSRLVNASTRLRRIEIELRVPGPDADSAATGQLIRQLDDAIGDALMVDG